MMPEMRIHKKGDAVVFLIGGLRHFEASLNNALSAVVLANVFRLLLSGKMEPSDEEYRTLTALMLGFKATPDHETREFRRGMIEFASRLGEDVSLPKKYLNIIEEAKRKNENRKLLTHPTRKIGRDRAQKERGRMSPKLRIQVLERDHFRCQYCGRSAPDVRLHVDHIMPISKGGRTEIENLQTLCQDCNLGKRDRLIKKKGRRKKKEMDALAELQKELFGEGKE